MKGKRALLVLFTIGLCLFQSCDKYLKLPYQVHNKTGRSLKLVVQQPQTGYPQGDFTSDTILHLQKDSMLTVGFRTDIRSGFDSTTNWQIYNEHPGMQNFSVLKNDSLIPIANADSHWSYKNGAALFYIEPSKFD